jgi:hypothetical protein
MRQILGEERHLAAGSSRRSYLENNAMGLGGQGF